MHVIKVNANMLFLSIMYGTALQVESFNLNMSTTGRFTNYESVMTTFGVIEQRIDSMHSNQCNKVKYLTLLDRIIRQYL